MSTMRLIDANALVEKAYWHGEHPTVDDLFADGVDAVDVSDIDEAPTIEAEPVRHGQWIEHDDGVFTCSECGNAESIESYFCRYCGAKMDGGAD